MNNGSATGSIRKRTAGRNFRVLGICVASVFSMVPAASPVYAKSEIKALREQVRELRAKNEQLEAELQQNEKPAVQTGKTEEAQERKQPLTGDSKAVEYNKKIRDLEGQNKQLGGMIAELQRQIKGLQEEQSQKQKLIGQAEAENQKLKEHTSDKEKLQQSLQALLAQNESLKNEIAENKKKEAELDAQKDSEYSKHSGQLQQTLGEIQAENRKLAQALADMTAKVLELEKNQSESQKAALASSDLAARIEELNQKNQALKAENESLASRGKTAAPAEKLQELVEQNKSLRETIRAQNDAIMANDGASKKLTAFQQENEELRQTLSEANQSKPEDRETIKQLRLEIATLQNEMNEKREQQAGIEELKQTVLALQEQNSQLLQRQSASETAAASSGEVQGDALGMAQVLQTQIEKEKAVNSEYRLKIKEYQDQIARLQGQDQGTEQPAAVSAVPAELAYDETVRTLMIQNQELKARIELMELGTKKKAKTKKVSQEKTSAVSRDGDPVVQQLKTLKVTEGSALPQVQTAVALQAQEKTLSAAELLEVEPMTRNVQLIRKNQAALPEMPPAQNIAGEPESDVAEGAKARTTLQAQQARLPEIQPAAGVEQPVELEGTDAKTKVRKDKETGHTNG